MRTRHLVDDHATRKFEPSRNVSAPTRGGRARRTHRDRSNLVLRASSSADGARAVAQFADCHRVAHHSPYPLQQDEELPAEVVGHDCVLVSLRALNNQNNSGNDPTTLWGNLAASRSAKPDKKIVDRQATSPSSWKTPFIATGRRLPGAQPIRGSTALAGATSSVIASTCI